MVLLISSYFKTLKMPVVNLQRIPWSEQSGCNRTRQLVKPIGNLMRRLVKIIRLGITLSNMM